MSTLERILGLYLDTLLREGERFAKIKLCSLSLKILLGARRVTLLYFYGFLACTLCTASIFSFLIYGVTLFAVRGRFPIDAFTVSSAAIAAVSTLSALWFLRESRWVGAFGLQDEVMKVVTNHKREVEKETTTAGLDPEVLKHLIDKLVDEKLGQNRKNQESAA